MEHDLLQARRELCVLTTALAYYRRPLLGWLVGLATRIVFVLGIAGALAAPVYGQTNLLANGGFDTGQLAPWQGATTAQVSAAAAYSGAYGVRLPSAQLLSQGWVSVVPGRTYVLTGWFRWAAFAGSEWGYDVFEVINNNWQAEVSLTQLASRHPQNTWVKLALTFVPTTSAIQVRFGVYGPKATVDQAWDDIRLFEKVGNLPPTVAPTASPTSGPAPLTVAFRAGGDDPDGAIAIYHWDFGDGSVSLLENPSHTFTSRRTYSVKLTATDNDGAVATQTLSVVVTSDTNPSISISQPTSQETYVTTASVLTLSGSASAPSGRTVQSVVWDNVNTDQAGIVSISPAGTVSWAASSIPLKPGPNEILVTATDSSGRASTDRLFVTRTFGGPVISNIVVPQSSVRVYEKFEVSFDLETVADNPFFRYDPAPPPGLAPGTGVTVEGVFVTPSGATVVHPAFYFGETTAYTLNGYTHFEETGRASWRLRFSPQETGTYTVSLRAQDASGSTQVAVGSFTATAPTRRGFIRVSRNDPRYFEFSNGTLYYPIGPANGPNYAQYANNGPNLERPWMGGMGAYSTNWAKWMRVDIPMGNEGYESPLTYLERYPSHELSRELFYPGGHRIWMGFWMDEWCSPDLRAGREYQIKLRLKTVGIAGPADGSSPYGFMVKTHGFPGPTIETDLRSRPSIIPAVSTDREWHTIVVRYVATPQDGANDYFSLLLENVTAGRVYIDQFSIREVRADGTLGGELIRHSKADMHTYVEQRPSAYFDWQVQQGEQYGVFFKYVVQDKNDWVARRLTRYGVFSSSGDGYFQPDGTKLKWLQQQWWRYLVARWGYSTAVHSWESCNEADPNDRSVWRHTQDFARFLKQTNAHPQMATTSFWCCWKPEFWGDQANYPDIDYADLHEYTNDTPDGADMAEWILKWARLTAEQPAGKPVILAETGIGPGPPYYAYLLNPNPGIWYHNLLWAQLNDLSGLTAPNYWWSEHFAAIDQNSVARPFSQFVSGLDVNKGGYVDAAATSSNSTIRAIGQKNVARGMAYLWIQNKLHTWRNVMGVENPTPVTPQSGTVTVRLAPNTQYTVERWDTYSGTLVTSQSLSSDGTGDIAIGVSSLSADFAVKFRGPSSMAPRPPTGVRIVP
jgi:PKD repeat protein